MWTLIPPFPTSVWVPITFAYDLIYNPEETRFLALAKTQGAQTFNGLPMLIGQAEKSWEFWNSP